MAKEADARLDALQLKISKAMYLATGEIAREASENFAPKGATLQLSRGIRALQPYINPQGEVVGVILSGNAAYAARQHNDELRHVSNFPLLSWFGDGQSGHTQRAKYAHGYRLAVSSGSAPKFATKYLESALEAKRQLVMKMLENAVRSM